MITSQIMVGLRTVRSPLRVTGTRLGLWEAINGTTAALEADRWGDERVEQVGGQLGCSVLVACLQSRAIDSRTNTTNSRDSHRLTHRATDWRSLRACTPIQSHIFCSLIHWSYSRFSHIFVLLNLIIHLLIISLISCISCPYYRKRFNRAFIANDCQSMQVIATHWRFSPLCHLQCQSRGMAITPPPLVGQYDHDWHDRHHLHHWLSPSLAHCTPLTLLGTPLGSTADGSHTQLDWINGIRSVTQPLDQPLFEWPELDLETKLLLMLMKWIFDWMAMDWPQSG